MTTALYNTVSLVLVIGIIGGINLMSSPKTAVKGNKLSAVCMLAAIVITLLNNGIVGLKSLWILMLIGSIIGIFIAGRVQMIQMPQLVALLNGFGGGASALVAMAVLNSSTSITIFSKCTGVIALLVGGITFSGSMIAAGKLARVINQRPVTIKGHSVVSLLCLGVLGILMALAVISAPGSILGYSLAVLLGALCFGIMFTVRVGGADMPITISLLNSFSGVAGSIAGFALYDSLLVAVGAIVGASGLLLTQIMCRAMNRHLLDILTGKTSIPQACSKEAAEMPASVSGNKPSAAVHSNCVLNKLTEYEILQKAQKVIVVPGYGMALAQAQHQIKQLADKLESEGKEVRFAIHPVAGRMPGHMNVLLAEVDVPYEQLFEMDNINPEFPDTDVVIVVGANDVVNPAANTAEGTPIYGMPVLKVDEARHVIICNFDTKPGYAGVDNPLYDKDNVILLLGDAKETVARLAAGINQCSQTQEIPSCERQLDVILREAQKVAVVPGYGMALAQAQHQVKQLADKLESEGKEVKFAIHPVAGRMPGHMNVLLAEVDVPYEKLVEMDTINPEFPDTDVVIVVGANDVVNPAANTAEGTPIYGMPVLRVDEARHVIICNFDTKPGYAGVDNPLYDKDNVVVLLGDAKETVASLTEELDRSYLEAKATVA